MELIVLSFALMLFACFLKIGDSCKVGEFKKSVDGQCPHGTSVVTNKATCSAITLLDGVQITFSKRPPPCLYMLDLPFGCYKESHALRFNPLDKEYTCSTKEIIVRSNNPSRIPSVCQCTGDLISAPNNFIPRRASVLKKLFTVSLSSHCPKGTTVLSDQTLCEQVGYLFSFQGPFKYAGKIGPAAQDKRPPGCFIDNSKLQTMQCEHVSCARFNEGDYSSHGSFAETTEFLAVCVSKKITTSGSGTGTSRTLSGATDAIDIPIPDKSSMGFTLSLSSRCPKGTTVLSDQTLCEQVGTPLSLQGPFLYSGEIGAAAQNKRPSGCFVDNRPNPPLECEHMMCAHFNEGDFPSHASFVQTTKFLAVCMTQPSTTSTTSISTTTTSTLSVTTTSLTTTLRQTSSVVSGCGSAGEVQDTPYCPPGTFNIYSRESCEETFKRLERSLLYEKNILGVRHFQC